MTGSTLRDWRRLVHFSALLVPILDEVTSRTIVLALLFAIVVVYTVEEVLRLKGRPLPVLTSFTLRMCRPEETGRFIVRPIYLAIGIITSLVLFPTKIAYASIAVVAVGDPVAAYVGEKWGRIHLRLNKTLEGLIAGLVLSFLAACIFVHPAAALLGAATAMLAELVDILDDNLTMPIAAGAVMLLASR